jgi:hypothetical protein
MGATAIDALPPMISQDLLRVFAMEAITHETTVTDTSATSRTREPQDRKTGQSRMPNKSSSFPEDSSSFGLPAQARSAKGWFFYWSVRGQSGEDKVEERDFGQ